MSFLSLQRNQENDKHGQKSDVDLAAQNYLEFLAEGRRVILEDTALLQDSYPAHRLFNLPCFKLPSDGSSGTPLQQKWAAYKAEVTAAHSRSLDENLQVGRTGVIGMACNCVRLHCLQMAGCLLVLGVYCFVMCA